MLFIRLICLERMQLLIAKLKKISPSQQISHWVRLGKFAENNSELTGQMLLDILNTQSPEL